MPGTDDLNRAARQLHLDLGERLVDIDASLLNVDHDERAAACRQYLAVYDDLRPGGEHWRLHAYLDLRLTVNERRAGTERLRAFHERYGLTPDDCRSIRD